MIEVVIAIAIGVFLVVAVLGVVQSLSRSARTMEASGSEDEAWLRFAQVFRRDVRGWASEDNGRTEERNGQPETAKPFFEFQTTADGLAGCALGSTSAPTRAASVRYSVRRNGEEFTILRTEVSMDGHFEVPVLQATAEPKVEFFDGKAWRSGQKGEQLPVAIRVSVGRRTIAILR